MRAHLAVVLATGLFLVGCGQDASTSGMLSSPAGPTAVTGSGAPGSSTPSASDVEVPFHSELTWEKIPGSDISLCTHSLPAGKVYLQRNTNKGMAVSTHLGAGAYENHTCVYGTPGNPGPPATPPRPEGWFADVRWTAANGDILLATSDFLYWTGKPGQSVAVDRVTFHDGGTGRFQFAEGEGMAYVDAPARTAVYEGTLRYGKKEK
jgi:hypothetical protein